MIAEQLSKLATVPAQLGDDIIIECLSTHNELLAVGEAAKSPYATEAPGSGGFPRPESGRPHDDLVPVIAEFPFLSEGDRISIFNTNPALVFPRLAEVSLT